MAVHYESCPAYLDTAAACACFTPPSRSRARAEPFEPERLMTVLYIICIQLALIAGLLAAIASRP